jgi:hypothetical protein
MSNKPWLVMGIGCLECRMGSEVLGLFATVEEAENFANEFDSNSKSDFVARVFNLSPHLSSPGGNV